MTSSSSTRRGRFFPISSPLIASVSGNQSTPRAHPLIAIDSLSLYPLSPLQIAQPARRICSSESRPPAAVFRRFRPPRWVLAAYFASSLFSSPRGTLLTLSSISLRSGTTRTSSTLSTDAATPPSVTRRHSRTPPSSPTSPSSPPCLAACRRPLPGVQEPPERAIRPRPSRRPPSVLSSDDHRAAGVKP